LNGKGAQPCRKKITKEAQKIINQLYQRCGEGGFNYLMMIDEGF
jgi:hypothetical protein